MACLRQLESKSMKHRFLLHLLSHNIIVVDISGFGMSATGDPPRVPALRFKARKEAQEFLRAKGADTDALETTFSELKRASVAVLTITK